MSLIIGTMRRPASHRRRSRRRRSAREVCGPFLLVAVALLPRAAAADAEGGWVLWEHSYEVWVDQNKDDHRRDVAWKEVAATSAKSACEDRILSEARAEYYSLIGRGVRATLAGSEVGFDQKNTRFTHGYRKFECWPDTVDPRPAKGK